MLKNSSISRMYIVLTFDIDNDHYFGESGSLVDKDILSWKGIEEGVPLILEAIKDCEDKFGTKIKKTWFVRADNQLKDIYGDTGYLLKRYFALWRKQMIEGDEIGLHLHIYQKSTDNKWIQETRPEYLIKKIREGYDAMKENNFKPLSSRIGEAYMSNEIVSTLNKLGIKIDSTAMPGRVRKDAKFQLDWLGTSQLPYHPSKDDYRVPGENQLNLLEVPMSMIYTKVKYDVRPLKRYVNLSFYNDVMKDGLRKYIREYKLLVIITHPFEVLHSMYNKDKKHPLISFNIGEIKKNIDFIISECKNAGKEYMFIRLSDLLNKNIYEDILNEG